MSPAPIRSPRRKRIGIPGRPAKPHWSSEESFDLGGREFVCRPVAKRFRSTPDRLCLRKAPWSVERYITTLTASKPKRILEVGIADGASTAMMAYLVRPERLVAVDISEERSAALDAVIADEGWQDSVHPHYGVDQAGPELSAIAEREFSGGPPDLIIDDASHELDRTRTTFEMLFPTLAPGGRYLIEDWSWAHAPLPYRSDQAELTILGFELMIACGFDPELITDIEVNRGWLTVHRGPREITAGEFALADHLGERGSAMIARLARGPARQ